MQGVSMVYSFDDPHAHDRHLTQYFEIVGNRAIYNDGWLAGTVHKAPWESQPLTSLAEDKWELYDTRADFSLVNVDVQPIQAADPKAANEAAIEGLQRQAEFE